MIFKFIYHLSILNPEFFLYRQTPRAAQNWKKKRVTSEDPTEHLQLCLRQLHWRTAGVLSQETSHCLGGAGAQGSHHAWIEYLLKSERFWPPGLRSFQPSLRRRCVVLGCQLPECWFANTIAKIPIPMCTSIHWQFAASQHLVEFEIRPILVCSA